MSRVYTFGPVKSRRLGLSLGVDILPKEKYCTFNCVYCEIGCTDPNQLVSPEYKIHAPPSTAFRKELKDILKYSPNLNSITFGYNGEPTLNENILDFLKIVYQIRDELKWNIKPKISILTNSSTLYLKEIRDKVSQFEYIIAKLDAAAEKDFKITNRPHKNVPKINEIINSIMKLKDEMPNQNKLSIQILLYQSYIKDRNSNINNENLYQLGCAIKKIRPDFVQLYSIARIPAEPTIYSIDNKKLENISKKLKKIINDNLISINHY
ncbi:MAG: hypothetical protein KGD63_02630 [Candidatus Lokiarchaeota archaeon]|nr:hypothetical protein [Candidatus Lokiarchaeota archaeon]